MIPLYTYKATVIRWVDGDTVDLRVDLGFRMWAETRFRLYGINTPERNMPGWAEATARCNELAPAGGAVTIKTYKTPEKYGRWLAQIWTTDTSEVNAVLVSEGLAVVYLP